MLQADNGSRTTVPEIINKRKKISEFIIVETLVKASSKYVWRWVDIEPKNR
jgi:hypothetical protein